MSGVSKMFSFKSISNSLNVRARGGSGTGSFQMTDNAKYKNPDIINAINRSVRLLNAVVLIIVFTLLFVNVKILYAVLDYIPSFSVVAMLTVASSLVVISMFLVRVISVRAIKEITEYDGRVNDLLMSNLQEIDDRIAAEEKLKRSHDELENRVKERTSKLLKSVRTLEEHLTERKRAENMVQLQFRRLNTLRSIERAISSSLDLRVSLDIILDQIITQVGIDAAVVLLLNQNTQTLEYVCGTGFRTGALKHTRLRLGEGNAGRAAVERRTLRIMNLKETPAGFIRSRQFREEGFATYFAVPLIAKGQVRGVLELFSRAVLDLGPEWVEFIETVGNQAAIAIDSTAMFEGLQRSNIELTLAYDTTIEGWSRAMDLRDKETEGHTRRVTEMTIRIARELGMKEEEIVNVRRGALLHDMGKMGVPDNILLKPGPLNEEEWKIMKMHPVYAFEMLYPIEYLRPALDIPYCHHEKWDGTGYPRGLKKTEIPFAARIFAVVDVFDAACSDRPYRAAISQEQALSHIRSLSGTHFEPRVVDKFLKIEWRTDLVKTGADK